MIKNLRRKFIAITMTSVFAVLFLIVTAVNVVNVIQNNDSADAVTQLILDSGGFLGKNPLDMQRPDFRGDDNFKGGRQDKSDRLDFVKNDFKDRFHNKDEMPFSTRFFTITLNADKEISSYDLESIASVSADDVKEFSDKIMSSGSPTGWYKTYRYRVSRNRGGYFIVILEATANRSSIISVLVITVIVGLAAFVLVFIPVALLSKRAIKPISETYEKQKQFITDASHELKTPLTVISANAEILAMTYGENEWSSGISNQTERMRALIGEMIQMSKLDEGGQTLTYEDFDLSEAVYDTAMSFKGIAGSKGLTLEVEAVPDIVFKGDEAAIRQVVSILTDNAVKYCAKNGSITVKLAKAQKALGKERIYITVRNSFENASALDTERLFDRFYRADKAHTANNSFGLGLSIAKSIIEHHGGTVAARAASENAIEFTAKL